VSGAPPRAYRTLVAGPDRALVGGALGATFLASLDVLMIATALPSAARDVGGLDHFALAVGAYAVTAAAGLPLGGALIDRSGPMRALLIGAVLFATGSILGGSAPSIGVIAAARAVQGLGGGLLFAIPPAVYVLYLPPELHRHAFGLNSAVWSVSALIGPPLGSLLTATLSWRWTFWINLPPLALTLALAYAGLRGRVGGAPVTARMNLLGPVLLGATVLGLLVEPLTAIVPALLFALHERRAALPVFPRGARGRVVAVLVAGAGIAFTGAESFVPLDLQAGVGWSVTEAALPLVSATMAWTAGSVGSAALRLDAWRQLVIGTAVVGVGCALMWLPAAGGLPVACGLTLAAVGMGIQSPAAMLAILSPGAGGEGRATSCVPLSRTLGGGVGIALAGAVIVALAGQRVLDAAQAQGAHIGDLHAAARGAFGACALGCLLLLPSAALSRRGSRAAER
jgi:MFS family permease